MLQSSDKNRAMHTYLFIKYDFVLAPFTAVLLTCERPFPFISYNWF